MILTLLDIPVMMDSLKGVCMELQDCALTLLKGSDTFICDNKMNTCTYALMFRTSLLTIYLPMHKFWYS